MAHHDVIVIGGGAIGAATTWALAERDRSVLMVERFEPGHARGSSHGSARVFRLGYEDADYISLGRRALQLWRRLERSSGAQLLDLCGVLDHGPDRTMRPIIDAFETLEVPHQVLDPERAATRWPGMRFDEVVIHHAQGGRVYAQRSLDVLYALARAAGATTRFDTQVTAVDVDGLRVRVTTAGGEVLTADRVVVTVGSWAQKVLGDLVDLPSLKVSAEQPMFFRAVDRDAADWIPFCHRGEEDKYGFGVPGEGVKVADHYRDEWLDPDDRPFDPDPDATASVSDYIRRWMPGLDPTPISSTRCLYTTTVDKDFVLDRTGPVVVGAGFSGHGFKFVPAIGEMLADLAEGATQQTARWQLGRDRAAFLGTK